MNAKAGIDAQRLQKGLAIAKTEGAIEKVSPDTFTVASQSGPGAYRVVWKEGDLECNCPDYVKRGKPCKHSIGVRFYLKKVTRLPNGKTKREEHPLSYGQAWEAYDRAQKEEIRLFDVLLHDLLSDVPEPERDPHHAGRPSIPVREQLFCAIQKVYSQLSCRRAWGLFRNAVDHGQLPKAPHYGITSEILNRDEVTAILADLITRSAMPLTALEQGFAPDSTGIQTTSFGYWREDKHGDRRERRWLKAHALVGVNTHVFVRVNVTDKNGADNNEFAPLLRAAAKAGIALKEVYADKAYLARPNFDLAKELKFDLYVPFKVNSKPRSWGTPLWHKAYFFFQLHREEFEAKYHQRSNVESAFSALKRKFGETLKSKNITAQVNELLAKVLAYNITVLIHEMFENGVVRETPSPENGLVQSWPTCQLRYPVAIPHTGGGMRLAIGPLFSNRPCHG